MHRALRLIATIAALALAPGPAAFERLTFPLRVGQSQRSLEDSTGAPFRVNGDTAWSLIAQLDSADVTRYFDDRAARGFNAVIVNLIEHKFSSNAPADRAGVRPFLAAGAFRDPNPEYFDKAHRVVEEAQRRGIVVWLCPAYLGWGGGDEGFSAEIIAAGPSALREYGRFVGQRFSDLSNIVWMVGGDYAFPPSFRWLGDELAAGLRDGGARQLMSAHGGQTAATDTFGDRPWLAIETVYSYAADLHPSFVAVYDRTPPRPFVLIESVYEGEHDARPEQIRRQAWTALLSGAAGQFFGNNPIWHFDGPTLFPFVGDWRTSLDSVGSRDMGRLHSFFRSRYSRLEPDRGGTVVTVPNDTRPVVAARTAIRDLVLAYFPAGNFTSREVSLNLRGYPRRMTARWFDPSSDAPLRASGVLRANVDGQRLTVPEDRGPASDWVLVLEAR